MSAQDTPGNEPVPTAATVEPEAQALTFDLDVEVCVVGGGIAGLSVAIEAARMGADVALLEARRVGWGASARPLGTVMPGYDLPLVDLVARVGLADARDLWALSREGVEWVRRQAFEDPALALQDGALEVSNVDVGEQLIGRLQMLNEDFETEAEGWQIDRVRDVLRTKRYFHGISYPRAFQIDGARYADGLVRQARAAGVRIFEETPVIAVDGSGIRKRIITPKARMRAAHLVLAGNVHLGTPLHRLGATLLPVWRYAGVTAPLGERLADVVRYGGSVTDNDGIDHFRVVGGDRLMWSSPETTWDGKPERHASAIRRRIAAVFPQLGKVEIAQMWSGAIGRTVHGMPQIGELRRGLWVASGLGRQGINTSATAGQVVARGIVLGDDRWKLFSPFELVWAGGTTGRFAGQSIGAWTRGAAAAAGAFARYREGALIRERGREARLVQANRQARVGARPPPPEQADAPAHPPQSASETGHEAR